MPENVVLVPGIGFGGAELRPLLRRLGRRGYDVHLFAHLPGRLPLAESAALLQRFLTSFDAEAKQVHFVAHSLGGRVTLRLFADHPEQRPGRLVFLGTPLLGCHAARRVMALPGGSGLLGPGVVAAARKEVSPPGLPLGREVGVIAGRINFISGLLLAPGHSNDSLICVEETRHPGLTDHQVLPVSHSSMLLSPRVAEYIDTFLRTGAFSEAANRITMRL